MNRKFTIGDCLFGTAKLTNNADPDKYGYSGYDIGFDVRLNVEMVNGIKTLLFLV